MTRQQRSRLITVAGAILMIGTILNIGRTDGWQEAVRTCVILVLCAVLLVLIIAWEHRGKP